MFQEYLFSSNFIIYTCMYTHTYVCYVCDAWCVCVCASHLKSARLLRCAHLPPALHRIQMCLCSHTLTHTHTHIHLYIYVSISVEQTIYIFNWYIKKLQINLSFAYNCAVNIYTYVRIYIRIHTHIPWVIRYDFSKGISPIVHKTVESSQSYDCSCEYTNRYGFIMVQHWF